MIHYTLGQKILNRMLLTGGIVGSSAEEDADTILNSKFVKGAGHKDWNTDDSSEYDKAAYKIMPLTAEQITIGDRSNIKDPEDDSIKTVTKEIAVKMEKPYTCVKIPVVKDTSGERVQIKIVVADIIKSIETTMNNINPSGISDGAIFYDGTGVTTVNDITSIISMLKKGINSLLSSTGFYSTSVWKESKKVDIPSYSYSFYERTMGENKYTEYDQNKKQNVDKVATYYYYISKKKKIEFNQQLPEYYYLEASSIQTANYPQKAFIGLFTSMPDPSGLEYSEPETGRPGLTYRRMNLHEDLFQGEYAFNDAKVCKEGDHKGKAMLTNKSIIMFPEVQNESWGRIVGFGVFEEEAVGAGTPYFWGRVENEKTASTETVPLFRIGDFQIYLG